MNIDHLNEQREAARAEFNRLWASKLEPRAISLGARQTKELMLIIDIAWQAFRAGQESGKPIFNVKASGGQNT